MRRFAPQTIVVWALAAASVVGVVVVGRALTHTGGLFGFVVPVWEILAAMGLVLPNAPAVALSRHPAAAGTSAALLGAAQFGLGAAVAPLVGVLGNDQFALVMTVGMVIALSALAASLHWGQSRAGDVSVSQRQDNPQPDGVTDDVVPEPA